MDDLTNRNVREKMIMFIKAHYAGVLGDDLKYLELPGGLDVLHKKYCRRS